MDESRLRYVDALEADNGRNLDQEIIDGELCELANETEIEVLDGGSLRAPEIARMQTLR